MSKDSARNAAGQEPNQSKTLSSNRVYTGVVERVDDARRLLSVAVDGTNSVHECLYAGGIFSGMFGLQTRFLPSKGTRVSMLYGRTCYVLGCLPSQGMDQVAGGSATMTGCGLPVAESSFRRPSGSDGAAQVQTHPSDLLEGELDLSNAFGTGMRLLTAMASINAGDRAKVEACLLNDMVRIVSETFRHYSSFGNYEIYNDGRLNVRFDGTSYPFEAAGVGKSEPRTALKDAYSADFQQVVGETGRWRFSEYVGFLGDFVTRLVTDPTEAIGDYAASNARAGKARYHVNGDGTILMQSVAEIVLERVVRIPVPVEINRPDDPRGNKQADFASLDAKYLKLWEYGNNPEDMAKTCYQLREYARWLSNYHSYARFHQLKKDWKVPSEAESPEPVYHNWEEDKVPNAQQKFIEAYATIRIMRDGSIVSMDGSGSSVTMANGNVHACAARNMHFEAAGDMTFTAGNDMHFLAGRSLAFTAVLGGFAMKARSYFRVLCEKGSFWLKSDLDPDNPAEGADKLGRVGILLDAVRSGVSVRAGEKASVASLGATDEAGVEILAARKGIVVAALQNISVMSLAGKLLHKAARAFAIDAPAFRSTAMVHALGESASISGGHLNATAVTAEVLRGVSSVQGPERGGGTDPEHYNHISTIDGETAVAVAEHEDQDLKDLKPPEDEKVLASRKWDYPPEASYALSNADLFESTAQQRARMEDAEKYEVLPDGDFKLQSAPNTGTNSPWPGKAARFWQHSGGETLGKPSADAYGAPVLKATGFNRTRWGFRKRKG
jgi:hypothetical protein